MEQGKEETKVVLTAPEGIVFVQNAAKGCPTREA